jgi:mono/diheme cytochrome c family protein
MGRLTSSRGRPHRCVARPGSGVIGSGRCRGLVAALVTSLVLAAACTEDGPSGDASAARGAEVYATSCATCHGDDLRGTDVGPPMLSEIYGPDVHSDEAFRASITGGAAAEHWDFGPMPAVGAVRGSDLDAVLAFVREQQELQGLEPSPPGG